MATTSLNLVYYASVAKGTMIVAEHINAVYDIASVALDFLEKLPPLHSRFTYTTSRRIFASLMDGSFTYCAIVDEALGKANAFTFLERVRDEFNQLLRSRGCGLDGQGLEAHSLVAAFAPAYRHLVKPLVGVPQKEMDPTEEQEEAEEMLAEHNEYGDGYNSQGHTFLQRNNINEASDHSKNPARLSEPPSEPLTKKTAKPDKRGLRDQVVEVKAIMMTNSGRMLDKSQKLEVIVDSRSSPCPNRHMMKSGSMRSSRREMISHMWWRNVKLVLIFDLIICLILLAIWLGVCQGFHCVKEEM